MATETEISGAFAQVKDGDTLALPEIDLAIPLAEFYEGLTFEDHPVEDNDNDQTPPTA